jgi:hypothetical protein
MMYKTATVANMYTNHDGTQSSATTMDQLYSYGKTDLKPPVVVPTKGRKKKKRIESQSVVPRPNGRKRRKCPICSGYGHFQSNCPNNPNKPNKTNFKDNETPFI